MASLSRKELRDLPVVLNTIVASVDRGAVTSIAPALVMVSEWANRATAKAAATASTPQKGVDHGWADSSIIRN
jgi:hypothetical protein